MNISALFDVDKLGQLIHSGYISARRHPHLELNVLNYTPKTQYEQLWNEVTLRCRGLVVDRDGEIVANCMQKFFNYGESSAANIVTKGPVQVTDKLDGSMGTVSFYHGELIVATRGSFESDQAKFAYDLIESKYLFPFRTLCGEDSTAVVEIIYPENRIVVDYGEMKDIVLLGVISNEELRNGRQLWTPADQVYSWPGPVVKRFNVDTFEDALRLPPRYNAEGIVVYFENTGDRLKIKQEEYIKMHKLIFNLTPRSIWSRLSAGETVAEIAMGLPDEFKKFVVDTADVLNDSRETVLKAVNNRYLQVLHSLPVDFERKDFALAVKNDELAPMLFMKLESQEDRLKEYVWKMIKP